MTAVCLELEKSQSMQTLAYKFYRFTPQGIFQNIFSFCKGVVANAGREAREAYIPQQGWGLDSGIHKAPLLAAPLGQRSLRLVSTTTQVHFWGSHLCWDDNVEEAVSLEDRENVFSEWWENSLERVYYRLVTKSGRELWLYRTAEGDFLQGEFV